MPITKNDLTVNELMVLNSSLRSAEKSLALGYLMLIGGHLGIHRFYLKRPGTATVQLVLFLIAVVSYFMTYLMLGVALNTPFIISLVFLCLSAAALFIWILVDLFLLPRMIREWNTRVEQEILEEIIRYRLDDAEHSR